MNNNFKYSFKCWSPISCQYFGDFHEFTKWNNWISFESNIRQWSYSILFNRNKSNKKINSISFSLFDSIYENWIPL